MRRNTRSGRGVGRSGLVGNRSITEKISSENDDKCEEIVMRIMIIKEWPGVGDGEMYDLDERGTCKLPFGDRTEIGRLAFCLNKLGVESLVKTGWAKYIEGGGIEEDEERIKADVYRILKHELRVDKNKITEEFFVGGRHSVCNEIYNYIKDNFAIKE